MPKKLFFKIDKEKRERVIKSAFQEFSNNVFSEASINKIIKEADISRGSFYQYFEDKQDIYFYIIDNILKEEFYTYIKNNVNYNKDIFDIFRKLFKFNLNLISSSKYSCFFKKLYLSLNYQISLHLNFIMEEVRKEMLLIKYDNNKLTVTEDKEYIMELINILQLINRNLISKKLIENLSEERIMELYDIRVNILKSKN